MIGGYQYADYDPLDTPDDNGRASDYAELRAEAAWERKRQRQRCHECGGSGGHTHPNCPGYGDLINDRLEEQDDDSEDR